MDLWINEIKGHDDTYAHLLKLLHSGHLPHGLAFAGPAGIGKRRVVYALAQAALCTAAKNAPCGVCPACVRVRKLQSESLMTVAPATSQIKLEQAREIMDFLSLRAASKRFVIIDEAPAMNAAFANSMLKLLEEPPAGTHFIFIAPAVSQLMPTVRSRLQTVRFFPLPDAVLKKVSGCEDWVVKAAGGSFTRLEEWNSPEAAALKAKAVDALTIFASSGRSGLEAIAGDIKERESAELTAKLFQQFFRDVLFSNEKIAGVVHADVAAPIAAWKNRSKSQILKIWQEAYLLQQNIAANLDKTLSFETFFIRARRALEHA